MINVAAIASLRTMPSSAEFGYSLIVFYILAGLFFFIPTSLVSAELATGWPQTGGVYIWVREAFGQRWGFLAIWLQWFENVIWYPTVLSFIAATFAYAFNPALAQNKLYMVLVILGVFWVATLINFRGMKISGLISTVSVILGTLITGGFMIALAAIWVAQGRQPQAALTAGSLIPDFTNLKNIAFLAAVLLSLAGMEMSAVHAQEVKNPQRDYPRAIFLSTILILALLIIGSLAIVIVVPQNEISVVAGIMEAFTKFLDAYNLRYLISVVAILTTIGALGQVSTWIVGPSKGLFATAKDGNLPPYFQQLNKNRMPTRMLVVQGIIVSALSSIFLLMPTVNSSYWLLTALTSQVYLIMYVLMFGSGIRLRYTQPDVPRAYKIPGGRFGIWVVCGVGIIGSITAIIIGFLPPAQIKTGGTLLYEVFMVTSILLTCAVPIVVHAFKRPSWKPKATEGAKKAA